MKFGTKVLHAGIEPEAQTGAIMTPIFQTSTYVQESPGVHKGYEYARTQNPTRDVLQKNLAALENGKYAFCFASGMAATESIIHLLKPGDEVISTFDLYGGTYRLFTKVYTTYGIKFHFVDMNSVKNWEHLINENTKMIWVETPTNPTLKIIDIKAIADLVQIKNQNRFSKKSDASSKGLSVQEDSLKLVVDNTFATPYLQNPLDLGADMVMHSVTKYISGHSDVVMGAVMLNQQNLAERIAFLQNACGAVPGPQDCFLVLRGIKTLHVRMQRHGENGEKVAHFLRNHPKVDKVYWPGFPDHPNHEIAAKQMRGFGGMISFSLKGDVYDEAMRFSGSMHIFSLAESLGGVESLIGHPASMTHASIPREERLKSGLTDSLLRLSVGIEDIEDILEDLEKALKKVGE